MRSSKIRQRILVDKRCREKRKREEEILELPDENAVGGPSEGVAIAEEASVEINLFELG